MTLKCFKNIQPFQGDSGGPMTYKQRWSVGKGQPQHVLIGVISYGIPVGNITCQAVTISILSIND